MSSWFESKPGSHVETGSDSEVHCFKHMEPNELRVKFRPRKINLEPRDLSVISPLADGEIVEDPLGRHKPGTTFVINHGDIGSVKFPKIMFPAPNPIEFYQQ